MTQNASTVAPMASLLPMEDLFLDGVDDPPTQPPCPAAIRRPGSPLVGRRPSTAPLPRAHWPTSSTAGEAEPAPCVVRVVRRPIQAVPRPIVAIDESVGAQPLAYEAFSGSHEIVAPEPVVDAEPATTGPWRARLAVGTTLAVVGALSWLAL